MKSHTNMVFRDYSSPYISEEHVYKRLSTRHLFEKRSKSDLTWKIFKSPFIAATIFFSHLSGDSWYEISIIIRQPKRWTKLLLSTFYFVSSSYGELLLLFFSSVIICVDFEWICENQSASLRFTHTKWILFLFFFAVCLTICCYMPSLCDSGVSLSLSLLGRRKIRNAFPFRFLCSFPFLRHTRL